MQPEQPEFPETEQTLGQLGGGALSDEAKARHLYTIRARAAELGPAGPAEANGASARVAGPLERLRWRGRRAVAVASIAVGSMTLSTGVAAAAAMNDLPGEPLYGLKRAIETVRLYVPADQSTQVERRLDLAQRRLEEAEALRDRDSDPQLLANAVADAHHMIDAADERADGDEALTATVALTSARASRRLGQLLEDGLPEQAAERAREAIEKASERAAAQESRRREKREQRRDKEKKQHGSETPSPHDSSPPGVSERRDDNEASSSPSPPGSQGRDNRTIRDNRRGSSAQDDEDSGRNWGLGQNRDQDGKDKDDKDNGRDKDRDGDDD